LAAQNFGLATPLTETTLSYLPGVFRSQFCLLLSSPRSQLESVSDIDRSEVIKKCDTSRPVCCKNLHTRWQCSHITRAPNEASVCERTNSLKTSFATGLLIGYSK